MLTGMVNPEPEAARNPSHIRSLIWIVIKHIGNCLKSAMIL